MKKVIYAFIALCLCCPNQRATAQKPAEAQGPTLITRSKPMYEVPSIASQLANGTFQATDSQNEEREFNPKR